jgi:hypothetical protein
MFAKCSCECIYSGLPLANSIIDNWTGSWSSIRNTPNSANMSGIPSSEQQPGFSRRAFIHGAAAALSSLGLSGCHRTHVMDTGRLVPPPGFDPNITPLTIDVHCHLFNGTDLQVAEFLKETHQLPGWAAALLQTINWRFAASGQDELATLRDLVSKLQSSSSPNVLSIDTREANVRKDIEAQVGQAHITAEYQLRKAIDDAPVQSPKLQWMQFKAGMIKAPASSASDKPHGPSNTTDNFEGSVFEAGTSQATAQQALLLYKKQTEAAATGRERLRRELPPYFVSETVMATSDPQPVNNQVAPTARFDKKSGVARFFLQYFSPRYVSAQDYLDTFCKKSKRNVDLMFASLVDYDWWLAGGMSPITLMQTQIEIMEQIAILSGGRVHAFAPFCPLREVAHRAGKIGFGSTEATWSPLALVQDAVANRGFIGVKMYPPMGFAPYGNAALEQVPTGNPLPLPCSGEPIAQPGPDFWKGDDLLPDWAKAPIQYDDEKPAAMLGQRMDEALSDLYRWCSTNGVPVLAHTNTSNGSTDDFMALAEAHYWEVALTAFPNLRVNFGHLGGFDEGDGLATIPCSSNEYLKLAAPSKQLYASAFADSAYEETMLRKATAEGERIGSAYARYPALASHFLYGSDWSLLLTQGKNDVYLKNFVSQMRRLDDSHLSSETPSASERFFGWNAVSYAGLAQGEQTRGRLNAFYSKNKMGKPLWAQKVDSHKS